MALLIFWLLLVVGVLWGIAVFRLRGKDLSSFDAPVGERFGFDHAPSTQNQAVIASLGKVKTLLKGVPMRQHKVVLRKYMDEMFADRQLEASFTPVDCGGVPGEWVQVPGVDGARRTLYIHGGAFVMGSPRSHRTLTSRFSALTGGAVLAIDYRLMPEHRRIAGIEDCRTAYRWMLDHGPQGAQAASAVFVAGDSAGGNLTLSLIAWVRDQSLRAPDAAVALSPLTDNTLASPSLRANVKSDAMLGPLFGWMARIPSPVLLWSSWFQNRIKPNDPLVSPLRGDLSRLPPVLLQCSAVEILADDSRRYVNRAQAAGSPAKLQTWNHMVHVWQIFNPELPEAQQALEQIGAFLNAAAPARDAPGKGSGPDETGSVPPQPAERESA